MLSTLLTALRWLAASSMAAALIASLAMLATQLPDPPEHSSGAQYRAAAPIYGISVSADERLIASISLFGKLTVEASDDSFYMPPRMFTEEAVTCAAFSPASTDLIIGTLAGGILSWRDPTLERPIVRVRTVGSVSAVAFSRDSRYFAAVASCLDLPTEIVVCEATTQEVITRMRSDETHGLHLGFSSSMKHLVVRSCEGTVDVWDFRSGERLRQLCARPLGEGVVACSPVSEHVVASHPEGTLHLISIDSGEILWQTEVGAGAVTAVAFSADGNHLFCGCRSGEVLIVDPDDGHVIESALHGASVSSLAPSADGEVVHSAGHDGSIVSWSLPRLELIVRRSGLVYEP